MLAASGLVSVANNDEKRQRLFAPPDEPKSKCFILSQRSRRPSDGYG
jgi:hypothetical protein